jgi:anti-sigma factor RsiW
MTIDDETLMAYADGQLAADDAAMVERAMAEDEAIAERVAMFAESRFAVRSALGAAPPVPDALTARIRAMADADARQRESASPANVVSLATRRRTVPFWQLPIAASVALGVGFLGGWIGAPGNQADSGLSIASLDDPAVVSVLETEKAGARTQIGSGAEVAVIASFLGSDGSLCREFEHDAAGRTIVAVACHRDDAWAIEFAVAAAASDASGYAPASSLDALDAWMGATEAGPPLSDAEEAAALDALR